MEQTNYQSATEIFELGTKQVIHTEQGDVPVFVIPDDMKVETLEHLAEQQRPYPYRIKDTVTVLSAESFVEYFNRFADPHSHVFADIENAKFVGVIDYHENGYGNTARWKSHQVIYTCPKTKEWSGWLSNNNEKMSQEEFALFIEDNLTEIMEPNGAQMLEIAASLKAKNNVDFKSSIRLDNGETQFTYQETIAGQAGVTGQLSIPEKIKLAIKPFQFGPPYECEARFRYRISSSGLTMWYTLIRPHLIHNDAVTEVFSKISEGITTGHIIQAKY